MNTTHTRKILVAVAPVGTALAEAVQNPLTPEEIARDVIASTEAGASMVHLHVRDRKGIQTEDITEFSRTLDAIRQESGMIIQGSTGGVTTLTREERCVSLNDPRVEVASLNMGSTNIGEDVYVNTLPDIRYWAKRMQERSIRPELEIFEGSMIGNVERLVREKLLTPPLHVNFGLGFPGPLPATPQVLCFLTSLLPEHSTWGIIHDGMSDFTMLAAAIAMGASSIRVGFEDSVYYAPGKIAVTNAELVTKVCELVRCLGYDVASPEEARQILGLIP